MTAPALPPALLAALDEYRSACREDARRAARGLAPNGREEVARTAVLAAIAAELAPGVAHDDACGLGEGTHFACDCTLRRLAELEALLREVEWAGNPWNDVCPACREWVNRGHAPGCRLAALLQGGTPDDR